MERRAKAHRRDAAVRALKIKAASATTAKVTGEAGLFDGGVDADASLEEQCAQARRFQATLPRGCLRWLAKEDGVLPPTSAARFACLRRMALADASREKIDDAVAVNILKPLGYPPFAAGARQLLDDLCVWMAFENPRRMRTSLKGCGSEAPDAHIDFVTRKRVPVSTRGDAAAATKASWSVRHHAVKAASSSSTSTMLRFREDRETSFPASLLQQAARAEKQATCSVEPLDAHAHLRAASPIDDYDAFAIDSVDTSEVDDAVSVRPTRDTDGSEWVYIHVADPTRLMPLGSPLDLAARQRMVTLYLPEAVVPMLPPVLGAGCMSLAAHATSPALTLAAKVCMSSGKLLDFQFSCTRLKNVRRLTYEQVNSLVDDNDATTATTSTTNAKVADGAHGKGGAAASGVAASLNVSPSQQEALRRLHAVAELRHAYRRSVGALDFNNMESESKIHVSTVLNARTGLLERRVEFNKSQSGASQTLVSELMLMAGEATAKFGMDRSLFMPYRGQEAPGLLSPSGAPLNKADAAAALATGEHGAMTSARLSTMSDIIDDEALPASVRDWTKICLLSRAKVGATPRPHWGVGFDAYVQVTSPIRRYPDVITHHQVKAVLGGETPPFATEESLKAVLKYCTPISYEAQKMQRYTENFWFKYYILKQTTAQTVWRGVVVEHVPVEVLQANSGVRVVVRVADTGAMLTIILANDTPRSLYALGDDVQFQLVAPERVQPNNLFLAIEAVILR
jgi:exoribonuclease R